MKRALFVVLGIWLLTDITYSKKLHSFPDVLGRPTIYVDNDFIILGDLRMFKVFIYNRSDYSLVSQFGSRGQGPGEFQKYPSFVSIKDDIIIHSDNKLSYFSMKGEHIKDIKYPYRKIGKIIKKVGNNYVVRKWTPVDFAKSRINKKDHYSINLYNSEFKELRNLYSYTIPSNTFSLEDKNSKVYEFIDTIGVDVLQDKIFIGDSHQGLYFEVFDKSGKLLYRINSESKRIIISDEVKKERNRAYEEAAKRYRIPEKQRIYPKYFPAFHSFRIFDEKIYVFTHQEKEPRKRLVKILDLNGNLLKETYLPMTSTYLSWIHDNYFYYSKNTDDVMELHVEEIE